MRSWPESSTPTRCCRYAATPPSSAGGSSIRCCRRGVRTVRRSTPIRPAPTVRPPGPPSVPSRGGSAVRGRTGTTARRCRTERRGGWPPPPPCSTAGRTATGPRGAAAPEQHVQQGARIRSEVRHDRGDVSATIDVRIAGPIQEDVDDRGHRARRPRRGGRPLVGEVERAGVEEALELRRRAPRTGPSVARWPRRPQPDPRRPRRTPPRPPGRCPPRRGGGRGAAAGRRDVGPRHPLDLRSSAA